MDFRKTVPESPSTPTVLFFQLRAQNLAQCLGFGFRCYSIPEIACGGDHAKLVLTLAIMWLGAYTARACLCALLRSSLRRSVQGLMKKQSSSKPLGFRVWGLGFEREEGQEVEKASLYLDSYYLEKMTVEALRP